MLVLAEVEVTENDDHAEFVRFVEDALQSSEVITPQRTIGFDGGVVPRLVLRVTLRRTALQIEGEREQSVSPPFGHGSNEFTRVAIGVPFAGVGIDPVAQSLRVTI